MPLVTKTKVWEKKMHQLLRRHCKGGLPQMPEWASGCLHTACTPLGLSEQLAGLLPSTQVWIKTRLSHGWTLTLASTWLSCIWRIPRLQPSLSLVKVLQVRFFAFLEESTIYCPLHNACSPLHVLAERLNFGSFAASTSG